MVRSLVVPIVFALSVVIVTNAFTIPLPFGGIDVNKESNGKVNVNAHSDVNILGFGGNSGLDISGGNGSFDIKPSGGILMNNTEFGANSTFGVDKEKGIVADTDINASNQTFHGGVGKESQFINEVGDAINKKKEQE